MLRYVLSRQLDAFERRWTYDVSYQRELLAISPWLFLKFAIATSMGQTPGVPLEARVGAGLLAILSEDCGPCTQISIDIALAGGVDPAIVRAVLAGDVAAMGETAALGYAFAKAVVERDGPAGDDAREAVERRWGKRGVAALSLAITTARIYPTTKSGLGYAKTCQRVVVAGDEAPFKRLEPIST